MTCLSRRQTGCGEAQGKEQIKATHRTSIVLEVNGLAGFPAFSFVVDAQLALQFNFYSSEPVSTPGRYVPKEEDEEPK